MKILEESARKLLIALGYENAATYGVKTLKSRLKAVPGLPEEMRARVKGSAQIRLLRTLIGIGDEEVEIVKGAITDLSGLPSHISQTNQRDEYATREGLTDSRAHFRKGPEFHVFDFLIRAKGWVTVKDVVQHVDTTLAARVVDLRTDKMVRTCHIWIPQRYEGYEVEVDGNKLRLKAGA